MLKIKDYLDIAKKGIIAESAPYMLQGAMIQWLTKVKMDTIIDYVQHNTKITELINQKGWDNIKYIAGNIGDTSWFTADWAIQAVRKDNPAIASLFMGWTKARNWLERQFALLREQLDS